MRTHAFGRTSPFKIRKAIERVVARVEESVLSSRIAQPANHSRRCPDMPYSAIRVQSGDQFGHRIASR